MLRIKNGYVLRGTLNGRNRPVWMIALIVMLAGVFTCFSCSPKKPDVLSLDYVDPLVNVLLESAYFPKKDAIAHVARGEHATFQFVLRCSRPLEGLAATVSDIKTSGNDKLPGAKVGWIGYVRCSRIPFVPSSDRLRPASGYYPDPILDTPPEKLPPFTSQPIWISVPVPADAASGDYTGSVQVTATIEGKVFRISQSFSLKVYPVDVSKRTLWVTNWFNSSGRNFRYLNDGEPVEQYIKKWWNIVRVIAKKMAEARQNVALISPLHMAEYKLEGEKWSIDFARFDRMVELFMEENVIGLIEGGHIGSRESHWTSPFVVMAPISNGDSVTFERMPLKDKRAQSFYKQFIPELVKHLENRGWMDIYMQHLAEQPIEENIKTYVEMARFIKKLAPGLKIIEACHTREVDNVIDVWVPQLDFMHEDYEFYRDRQANGDEIWFYTCLKPQGEYANRFIDLPLIKTRILHWMNYRFEIPGYLHWGFNYWAGDVYDETTRIFTEGGNRLPAGDSWIVYPAKGKLLNSIRLDAMRDGIADYELLKKVGEKDPEKAAEFARQVVYLFDRYDMSVDAFRQKRIRMLEFLSQ